jgi:hypothetical protein
MHKRHHQYCKMAKKCEVRLVWFNLASSRWWMTEYSLQVYGTPAFLAYELYKSTQFRILSLSSIIHSTLKQLTIRTKTSDHIKCSDTPLQKHIIDIDNNRKRWVWLEFMRRLWTRLTWTLWPPVVRRRARCLVSCSILTSRIFCTRFHELSTCHIVSRSTSSKILHIPHYLSSKQPSRASAHQQLLKYW